ncbi:MAG: phosphatidate cytidylyltransferase [Gemmatimonadales bacterium]
MASNLAQRVAIAALAIPAAGALLWVGGWPLAAGLAALGVLGTHEVYGLARRQGIEALDFLGWAAAAAIPLLAYGARAEPALHAGALWLMWVLVVAMQRLGPTRRPLAAVAVTLFGALYASGLLAFLLAIRHGPAPALAAGPLSSFLLALFPLAITWIGDTCAMAAGVSLGGPPLAPVLSPRKTRAGAVGGLAGAILTAVLAGVFVLNRAGGWNFTVWQLVVVGTVVGVVAQLGDVAESLLKREAGVKDSSTLIPGHGGVLDRLDSLYFVIPSVAILYRWFGVI